MEIHNPKGEKVLAETKKADQYGGLDGEWKVPADATLGVYSVSHQAQGLAAALNNPQLAGRRHVPRRGV